MGAAGYTGLKTLGEISITVGSRTSSHPAYINEEEHFDVVLGRSWLEKMGIKWVTHLVARTIVPGLAELDPVDLIRSGMGDDGEPEDARHDFADGVCRTDALDPTNLTYMDTGEAIACELVVLRDADGNVVLLT